MTANVICFASAKGGSGKTTISAAIGTFLNEIGKRVLLVDCDEGTHGLTLMFLNEVNENRKERNNRLLGLFDNWSTSTPDDIEASIIKLKSELHLMPAKHTFSKEQNLLKFDFPQNLKLVLQYAKEKYDYIIFDAQAGIGIASKTAMSEDFSDTVILVSEYDPMSNAGVERLKARLPTELDVSRTWVLLNKLLPEFVSKFSDFLTVAKFLPPIPWTADVVRAYSRRKLALDFKGGNQFTLAILSILREVMPENERGNLEEWVSKQTERLREPITEQISDAELLLSHLEKSLNNPRSLVESYRYVYKSFSRITMLGLTYFGLVVAIQTLGNKDSAVFESLQRTFPFFSDISHFFVALLIGILSFLLFNSWMELNKRNGKDRSSNQEDIRFEMTNVNRRLKDLRDLARSDYEKIVNRNL